MQLAIQTSVLRKQFQENKNPQIVIAGHHSHIAGYFISHYHALTLYQL